MANKKGKVTPISQKRSPKRKALGRGLSSLVSSSGGAQSAPKLASTSSSRKKSEPQGIPGSRDDLVKIALVPVNTIENDPSQPRQNIDQEELAELTDSIKEHGVLQPILVKPAREKDRYQIIAGERRWRASQKAGLKQIPVIIHSVDPKTQLEIALVENIQRQNLNAVEEALAYQRLIDEHGHTQQQVAARVGKDRTSVANHLRLLKLPAKVLLMVKEGKLSVGHAKAILTVKEPAAQIGLAQKAFKEGLSVRALEAIVSRNVKLKKPVRKLPKSSDAEVNDRAFPEVVDRLRKSLGTKVRIRHHSSGRGRIEVEYFSEQELDRLVEVLTR